MARFAGECQNKFSVLVQKLEVTLGPDTAELGMRFGLHSGAVTAGVLRGMLLFWTTVVYTINFPVHLNFVEQQESALAFSSLGIQVCPDEAMLCQDP